MGYYNNKRKKVEAVQIEYSKKAVKYINSADKLTKSEVEPEPDELAALLEGRQDRKENGTISHNDIDWDL